MDGGWRTECRRLARRAGETATAKRFRGAAAAAGAAPAAPAAGAGANEGAAAHANAHPPLLLPSFSCVRCTRAACRRDTRQTQGGEPLPALPLHELRVGQKYYLAMFLTGEVRAGSGVGV